MSAYTFHSDDLGTELSDEARFRLWHDMICAKYGSMDIWRAADKKFVVKSEITLLGPVQVLRLGGTVQRIGQRPDQRPGSRFPDDTFVFMLNESTSRLSNFNRRRGRETLVDPGTGSLFGFSDPGEIRAERGGVIEHCNLILPRLQLCEVVRNVESFRDAMLDPASPAIRHLRRYLQFLSGPDDSGPDPALARHAATTVLDLVALSLGAKGDASEIAHMRGLRAARLQECLHQIRVGFTDPGISPEQIARKLGLSSRYLQQLLQDTGSTFTERVLELRLQRARQMLVRTAHRKISDIAYACGFNEVSYFNRCFRRRFGDTPTGYRGSRTADD